MANAKPEKQAKKHALTPEMEARKWPKGFCPNPGGRPKGSTSLFAAIVRELVNEVGDDKALRAAAKAYVARLKGGSFPHAKELMERQDGAVSSDVTVRVVFVKPNAPGNPDVDDAGSQN